MYGKIFDSMYEGTLYGHWQAIVTLQQMLVLCNQDGVIDMTPQAIAARTSIPLDIITPGIETLSAPDPYSRTPDEEGRRIVLLDEHRPWGWRLVNYAKYQQIKNRTEKLTADRDRIAAKRKANKNADVAKSRGKSHPVAYVAPVTLTASEAVSVKSIAATPLAPDAARRGPKVNGHAVKFDFEKGEFVGITEDQELRWQEAFPAVPVPPAIAQAAVWLKANPANRKSNYERFLVNWFKRDQDKAPRVRR